MASIFKITIKRGQTSADCTVAAGDNLTGEDAMNVNFDVDKMSQREALVLLDEVKKQIIQANWPQL